jgi:hypothetical protein
MKVIFLSQTTGRSSEFSICFAKWIKFSPVKGIKKWASWDKIDLPVGDDDFARILNAAKTADYCISFLTPENLKESWINFEAGIFYSRERPAPIVSILCGGLAHQTVKATSPIGQIYSVYPDNRESLLNLLTMLDGLNPQNERTPDADIQEYIDSQQTDKLLSCYDKVFSDNSNKLTDAKLGLIDF